MAMFREGEGMFDFVMMDTLDESSFMANLKERFLTGRCIFTYIGEQIVLMNPFQRDKSLYTTETMDTYIRRFMYEVQPHIYALADDTFRSMMTTGKNQCVLITGESGAGKTEASKIFMQYIAHISKSSSEAAMIKDRLLESNPVLEAFGNAKTLRNDNSSRFGKYMELQFDLGGTPIGGKISQYLLEKGRVVTRGSGERSYHIFYQLLSQQDRCGALGLQADPSQYNYLKASNCYTVSSINDSEEWDDVMRAMGVLGWEESEIENIGRVLAAILITGNVGFNLDDKLTKEKGTDSVVVSNTDVLDKVVELLQCERAATITALTTRAISTGVGQRASSISVPLDMKQAVFARDSLAKGLYSALFNWTVNKINAKIASGVGTGHFDVSIGVLDIYGFEIMEDNSFEQLCINYCNEKLQQLFIRNVLKAEQEEYANEGIEWTEIDYFDNQPIISMIEGVKRGPGLYPLLDEACAVGEATPSDVVDKFANAFRDHPHFVIKGKVRSGGVFHIQHYAGEVSYNAAEMLFKNRDTFFDTLLTAMHSSSLPLLGELFPASMKKDDSGRKKKPLTAGFQFKKAVCALIDTLSLCQPHYIRCIKSNDQKRAFNMDEERVRHQVLYLNLVETTRVRRAGFCNRQHYTRFLWRYKMLSDETWPTWKGDDKSGVQAILNSLGVSDTEYKLGKTKLFIKAAQTFMLVEQRRTEELPKVAIQIQRIFKGWKTRKWFLMRREQLREEIRLKRALSKIVRCWLRSKARQYMRDLSSTFAAAKDDKGYGKGWEWPVPWERFAALEVTFKNLWLHWWAYMMVSSLKGEENALMRQKVLCLDVFGGQKPWGCARRFKADYIDGTPKAAEYQQAINILFQNGGDACVLFSDNLQKINPKGKSQLRAIIVTDKHIYKYDPVKFVVKKEAIPLLKATSISCSKLPDTFVVVHFAPPLRDLIVDCGALDQNAEKVSEFVSVIKKAHEELSGNALEVKFSNSFTYNNTREADAKNPGMVKKPGTDMCFMAGGKNPGKPSTTCVFEKAKKAKNTWNVYHP